MTINNIEIQENITKSSICVYYIYENTLSVSECSLLNTTDPFGHACTCLYFNRVFVHPKVRHMGVGTKLVKRMLELVDDFKLALCCDINSYGDLDYNDLFFWYQKLGFKSYEKRYGDIVYNQLWYRL